MDEAQVERIHGEHRPRVPVSKCRWCQQERATCRKKRRYQTGDEAADKALEINVETEWERDLVSYKCPWCDYFHHKTAKTGAEKKRVARFRRRWMEQQ